MSATQLKVSVKRVDAEENEKLVAELEARLKAAKAQTKGMTIRAFEYETKDGERRSGVALHGLGMKPHQFFAEQILRLVDDSPEAEANRAAIRQFIVDNKDFLTWKK